MEFTYDHLCSRGCGNVWYDHKLGKNGCVDHCIKSGEAKLICRGHKGKKDKRFGKGKGKTDEKAMRNR